MPRKIGLIQTGGIGDIIIALPIADYYLERGCEVYWPIDERFCRAFAEVKPQVRFIPVPDRGENAYTETFYTLPLQYLQAHRCEQIFCLYSRLRGMDVCDDHLATFLKFDEYKYALAKVPFARKWDLRLERNLQRERDLHARLGITGPYICVHDVGSDCDLKLQVTEQWSGGCQVVRIQPLTDSVFDWIYTLEHARRLVLLDSCFANLVEQLNLPNDKLLILRTNVSFTPVFKNAWSRLLVEPASDGLRLRQV